MLNSVVTTTPLVLKVAVSSVCVGCFLEEFSYLFIFILVAPVEGQDMSRPALNRSQSRAFLSEDGMPQPIEYFLASDASAIVEHTKRVLYMEDDDIAHIADGGKLVRCGGG